MLIHFQAVSAQHPLKELNVPAILHTYLYYKIMALFCTKLTQRLYFAKSNLVSFWMNFPKEKQTLFHLKTFLKSDTICVLLLYHFIYVISVPFSLRQLSFPDKINL